MTRMSGSSATWSTSWRSWMTWPVSSRIRLVRPRVGSLSCCSHQSIGRGVALEDLVEHALVGRVVGVAGVGLAEERELVGRLLLPVDEEAAGRRVAAVEPQQVALALGALALPVGEELARGVVGAEHVPAGADDVGRVGVDRVEQLLELLAEHLGLGLAPRRGARRDGVEVGAAVGVEAQRPREPVDDRLARPQVAAALDEVVVGDGDVGQLGDLGATEPHPPPALGALDADLLGRDRVPARTQELAERGRRAHAERDVRGHADILPAPAPRAAVRRPAEGRQTTRGRRSIGGEGGTPTTTRASVRVLRSHGAALRPASWVASMDTPRPR